MLKLGQTYEGQHDAGCGLRHIPALDGIRGLAILMVLMHHFVQATEKELLEANHLVGLIASKLTIAGWRGVDLFFVLSGFLITGILYEAKGSTHYFRNFYARRFLRIFPLYYGVLLVLLVLVPLFVHPHSSAFQTIISHQWWLWLYAVNLPSASHLAWYCNWFNLGHLWSLSVEEHFYFVWPVFVFLLSRQALMRTCGICVVGALFLRAALMAAHVDYWVVYTLTPCRVDALAMGAWLALAVRNTDGPTSLVRPAKRAALIGGIMCAMIIGIRRAGELAGVVVKVADFTITAFFFASVIVLSMNGSPRSFWGRFLQHPVMMTLGKYSYGLYVLHFAILPMLLKLMPVENISGKVHSHLVGAILFIISALAISFGMAFISWHLYEKQFLKLKRFFEYRSQDTPRSVAMAVT